MPVPRCIVAATDFSGTSREALRVARDLADEIGARVYLLHVVPDPARMPWSVDTGVALGDLEKDWRHQAELSLADARDEAGFSPARTVLTVATGADAASEIVAVAAERRAHFIVIGTHGHGFVARLVLGSVADRVVRQADRPVLIVPHPVLKHLRPEAARTCALQGVTA